MSFFIRPGEEGTTKANKKRRKPQFNSEKKRDRLLLLGKPCTECIIMDKKEGK